MKQVAREKSMNEATSHCGEACRVGTERKGRWVMDDEQSEHSISEFARASMAANRACAKSWAINQKLSRVSEGFSEPWEQPEVRAVMDECDARWSDSVWAHALRREIDERRHERIIERARQRMDKLEGPSFVDEFFEGICDQCGQRLGPNRRCTDDTCNSFLTDNDADEELEVGDG